MVLSKYCHKAISNKCTDLMKLKFCNNFKGLSQSILQHTYKYKYLPYYLPNTHFFVSVNL